MDDIKFSIKVLEELYLKKFEKREKIRCTVLINLCDNAYKEYIFKDNTIYKVKYKKEIDGLYIKTYNRKLGRTTSHVLYIEDKKIKYIRYRDITFRQFYENF